MNIEQAINIYNELYQDEKIKSYCDALHTLCSIEDFDDSFKKKTEIYKEGKNYKLTIILPHKKIRWSNPIGIITTGYDGEYSYTDKFGKNHIVSICLKLCGYSKEKIIEILEKRLEELFKGGELL